MNDQYLIELLVFAILEIIYVCANKLLILIKIINISNTWNHLTVCKQMNSKPL